MNPTIYFNKFQAKEQYNWEQNPNKMNFQAVAWL